MNFLDLQLSPDLVKALSKKGYSQPTRIQVQTIPLLLEGKDVIGQAQTGTGKTAAYALPLLDLLDPDQARPQALILTPTRELASQVKGEIDSFGYFKSLKCLAIFGGVSIKDQIKALKQGSQILVATPGRLLDLLQRGKVDTSGVTRLVLDEADQMLDMGFIEDIKEILSYLGMLQQTALFSATLPDEVLTIAKDFIPNYHQVSLGSKSQPAQAVSQFFTKVKDSEKFQVLHAFLRVLDPKAVLVFVRTKKRVDEMVQALQQMTYQVEGLHSDFSQKQRLAVMHRLKTGQSKLLVATDLAARGLDIDHISHVFNFDAPQDAESYTHRIGRTGRAGSQGMAITFFEPKEHGYLKKLEKEIGHKLQPLKPPTSSDLYYHKLDAAYQNVQSSLDQDDLVSLYPAAEDLLDHYPAKDLVALLVKVLTEDQISAQDVKLSPQKDLPHLERSGKKSKNKRGPNKGQRKRRQGKVDKNKRHRHKRRGKGP